jgi:hypothetical protein
MKTVIEEKGIYHLFDLHLGHFRADGDWGEIESFSSIKEAEKWIANSKSPSDYKIHKFTSTSDKDYIDGSGKTIEEVELILRFGNEYWESVFSESSKEQKEQWFWDNKRGDNSFGKTSPFEHWWKTTNPQEFKEWEESGRDYNIDIYRSVEAKFEEHKDLQESLFKKEKGTAKLTIESIERNKQLIESGIKFGEIKLKGIERVPDFKTREEIEAFIENNIEGELPWIEHYIDGVISEPENNKKKGEVLIDMFEGYGPFGTENVDTYKDALILSEVLGLLKTKELSKEEFYESLLGADVQRKANGLEKMSVFFKGIRPKMAVDIMYFSSLFPQGETAKHNMENVYNDMNITNECDSVIHISQKNNAVFNEWLSENIEDERGEIILNGAGFPKSRHEQKKEELEIYNNDDSVYKKLYEDFIKERPEEFQRVKSYITLPESPTQKELEEACQEALETGELILDSEHTIVRKGSSLKNFGETISKAREIPEILKKKVNALISKEKKKKKRNKGPKR